MIDAGKYVAPGSNCTIPNVGLPVRRERSADIWPFVIIKPQDLKAFFDVLFCPGNLSFFIGIL